MVGQEKKHRVYHFIQMLDNLKEMSAVDFAKAIKGKPENLGCKTGYELLFTASTRFMSINSFRECLMQNKEDNEKVKASPIVLLDPTRIISHRKFRYGIE
jgi:hypothetical protein